jgi:two-component system, chemotaxis family, CheB/CheR fusion protein
MAETDDLLVVGIGASAGGVQAIRHFFEHVPAPSGIAYVVILHLSPDHESHLAEVLQGVARIPVSQVRGRVKVEPDHAYVISPLQSLTIEDGHLEVAEPSGPAERRAPVDIFFRALASSHGPRAVCVILSGTGADGSMGLKRIKEQGGLCLVQDPDEAEHADMPRHAIATGLVDAALPVAAIPGRIVAYRDRAKSVRLPEESPEPADTGEDALREIIGQLRARTGHDFSSYKRPTVLRRIARRMSLHEVADLQGYAELLRQHPDEARALLKDLLISVTNFFRDPGAFEKLRETVVPRLFEGKGEHDQVRVWVPGCATGEEAYSIAMLLAEFADTRTRPPGMLIFATDIDETAVRAAREGIYTRTDMADVSTERLRRFFLPETQGYRVRKELREMVLFAHHNIIRDPPFSHLDLVSCRNLLIYLNRAAQQRVMQVLHFALSPERFLFLGSSEAADGFSELFAPVEKDAAIFRSRPSPVRRGLPVPDAYAQPLPAVPQEPPSRGDSHREPASIGILHQQLLELYAPPSLLVNEHLQLVHLSDRAGRYLQHPGGEPTADILKAIQPDLRLVLRAALNQAAQERATVQTAGARAADRPTAVTLVVKPVLRDDASPPEYFLVFFQEEPIRGLPSDHSQSVARIAQGDAARQLEEEAHMLRVQLRAQRERYETQSEELRASNEELQAMNEELRSSTEELETSKEELQALNEELRTVNQELKIKIEEQVLATDDILNLINSTEIGTIFLDRSSRLKLFTPPALEIFNLIPADEGRPLSDIRCALVDADLGGDIERVLDRLERVEREVATLDGRWIWMRILPYRTADDRIGGVVLTFLDITRRKRMEDRLSSSEARLRLLIDSVTDYAIFTLDADGLIASWNAGAARLFGYTDNEAIGMSFERLFTPEDRQAGVPEREQKAARESGQAADERWHLRKDGSRFFASGVLTPLSGEDSETGVSGYVKVARDLTERKQWEDALTQAHADLEFRVRERTAQLAAANVALDTELQERREANQQIRGLLRRLITAQEDERRRIGRDLHDQLGQEVVGLRLRLSGILETATDATVRARIEDALQILEKLDQDLDFHIWELRPPGLDDLGLVKTLERFVQNWSREFGIAADFHSQGLDKTRLPHDTEINLYRITQEALNNVLKHADASRVAVILECREEQLVLVIEDDGIGFDRAAAGAAERGIGLIGMQERAALIGGTLEIEAGPGAGTTIFVRAPLTPDPASAGRP